MTNSINDYIKTTCPWEYEDGFIEETAMTWDEAADLFKKNRAEEIFTKLGCEDTAFRDEIFEGLAAYLGMTWKAFAAWGNKTQTAFEFRA